MLLNWLKKHLSRSDASQPGTITRTCRMCGKTFTLPGNAQYWPDLCQECRAKAPAATITRKCRKCGKEFTFSSALKIWPKICEDCRAARKERA